MRFMLVLAAWLFLLSMFAVSCPNSEEHNLAGRWISLAAPGPGEPLTYNAWPAVDQFDEATDDEGDEYQQQVQSVRYCYKTKADYDTLHFILEEANIKHWAIAEMNSAFRLRSDVGDQNNPHKLCICDQEGVRRDALQISDVTNDPAFVGKAGSTTQGYTDSSIDDTAGRHFLKFRRIYTEPGRAADETDVLLFAHQIGHAICLEHEHARPDRDQYIEFRCENLIDYDDVVKKIAEAGSDHTIAKACSDRDVALKYGFSAWAYLPGHLNILGGNVWSQRFDEDSIMIYNSYDGGAEGKGPVIMRKNGASRTEIQMGGFMRSVSDGDVARVRQMYPEKDFNWESEKDMAPGWLPHGQRKN